MNNRISTFKGLGRTNVLKTMVVALAFAAPLATTIVGSISFAAEENKSAKALDPEFMKGASYSLGARYAQAIRADFGEDLNLDELLAGFQDVFKGEDLKIADEKIQANLLQLQQIRTDRLKVEQEKASAENKAASDKFLTENKEAKKVKATDSGLQYKVLESGKGEQPSKDDTVTVHYHGTLVDGTVFDSSKERGTPATFPVAGVIPGWTEALQMMSVGDKWMLYIPAELAYGPTGTPGGPIGPNQALIFEVELLSVGEEKKS